MFRKEEIYREPEPELVALLIHFTPDIIYVYISLDNDIESNLYQPNVELGDMNGHFIEISGNYIIISDVIKQKIDEVLKQYGIDKIDKPVIQITVE